MQDPSSWFKSFYLDATGQSRGSESSNEIDDSMKQLAKGCINGFEFEEAVKLIDNFKPLICHSHGEVELKKVFPDVVSKDSGVCFY